MSHDLIAELTGYQQELAGAEQRHRKDRTEAVRSEIERVVTAVARRVEQLLAQADNHEDAGEDLQAANARVEAKRLARAVIDAGHEDRLGETLAALRGPGFQTTEQTTPQETATPPKSRRGRTATSEGDA
ncbi:MAG TPA: hypothetical protein VGX25_04735 [Actinophytocola sp.]|uniref:hypothetical protein n=1 Tax=Actinophytocola sp. TaxID=1872138 RepID=UPI002DDDBA81|nr:hypothetical protein [Actinophytocola sp.]HEV2778688.1 hypothetical protein [Actinophytocola sp.]